MGSNWFPYISAKRTLEALSDPKTEAEKLRRSNGNGLKRWWKGKSDGVGGLPAAWESSARLVTGGMVAGRLTGIPQKEAGQGSAITRECPFRSMPLFTKCSHFFGL